MKHNIDDLISAARAANSPPEAAGNFDAQLARRLRGERSAARTERIEGRCAMAVFAVIAVGSIFWLGQAPEGASAAASHEEVASAALINGDYYLAQLAGTGEVR